MFRPQVSHASVPLDFTWSDIDWSVRLQLRAPPVDGARWNLTNVDVESATWSGSGRRVPQQVVDDRSSHPEFRRIVRRTAFPVLEPQGESDER